MRWCEGRARGEKAFKEAGGKAWMGGLTRCAAGGRGGGTAFWGSAERDRGAKEMRLEHAAKKGARWDSWREGWEGLKRVYAV